MKKLFLIILLLGGCSQIHSGTITDKNYYPAHDTEEMVEIGSIDTGDFHFPIYGTETVHHPNVWTITFENVNENDKKVKRTINVEQEIYNKVDIGQWFDEKELVDAQD